MNIPLCDLNAQNNSLKTEIYSAIDRVITNSNYILGDEVCKFEQEFAIYNDSRYCVGVDNATDGLFLALKAIGISDGDQVIIPTFTVTADYEAVIMVGGIPILCDVNNDGNITIEEIENKITDNTKAIIAVHMFGNPCDVKNICDMAHNKDIHVIEDCSHAHGALVNDRHVGTFGDIGVFSFFPSKILGCLGDGGAVITNNEFYYKYISAARNHGRCENEKHCHDYIGFNMRLDAIQAAILRIKLKHLDEYVYKRKKIAGKYYNALKNIYNPIISDNCVWYVYPIRHAERDYISETLNDSDISTGCHYPIPIHRQPFYAFKETFCNANVLSNSVLSIPIFPEMTDDQVNHVINTLLNMKLWI